MAGEGWIEAVYNLSTLPAPLDTTNGRITASAVSTLSRGKKRKRTEIATAIDGEGVNLYSAEDSSLIASYAVSPNTYFDAAPCSVCCRHGEQIPQRRLTYAASRPSRTSEAVRLGCFEAGLQESSHSASQLATQPLPSPASVALIDTLPIQQITTTDASHQVLALQKDGTLTCFSEKADKSLWSTNLSSLPTAVDGFDLPEGFALIHAELISLDSAAKGILKGRQDVLAAVGDSDAAAMHILTILTTSSSIRSPDYLDLDLHIYSLRSNASAKQPLSRLLPQHLLSWSVPQVVKRLSTNPLLCQLVSSAGSLTELNDGNVVTYDLSDLTPKVVDAFTARDKPQSVIRLSSSLLLTASSQKFAIYDSKYGSVLASREAPLRPSTTPKKSEATDDGNTSIELISYLATSGKAVALQGKDLVVLQISESAKSNKRKKEGTLLIDSLGKGTLDSRLRSVVSGSKRKVKKNKRSKIGKSSLFQSPDMDALLESGDLDGFDKRFAGVVDFKTTQGGKESTIKAHTVSEVDWKFPAPAKLHRLPTKRSEALYALSKLFEPAASSLEGKDSKQSLRPASIRMKAYPENVFLWLTHTGQLRADLIKRAMNEYLDFDGDVPHGDLIKALAEWDDDLSLVHYLLTYHPHLHIDELVAAIKIIVKSLDNSTLPQPEHKLLLDDEFAHAAATTGALTNGVGLGVALTNGDIPMVDGATLSKPAEDLESVTDAAMKDLDEMMDQAYETLDKLLPIRGEALRHALTKLNALPAVQATRALQDGLTQHELIFLIHILRVELDQGGWTTRYGDREDDEGGEATDEPSNRAISVISNMLGCAVDAVGMSGWLTSSAANPFDSIDETLTLLRGEISNTLEGVHEATFVNGVLSDFLRHHYKRDTSEYALPQTRKATDSATEEALWKAGKTVVVENAPPPHLPMGLGMEEQGVKMAVNLYTENSYGGLKKKRMADVGREIRRNLPPYLFERIRF